MKIMPFSNQENIKKDYERVEQQYRNLFKDFSSWYYRGDKEEKIEEYLFQGYLRRLDKIKYCIYKIHELCPLERTEKLSDNEIMLAEMSLQTFYINLYGIMDNIAWIWNYHNNLNLDKHKIGILKKDIKNSFSCDFQKKLEKFKKWFKYLEEFRHSLAHRIPIYIPPSQVTDEETEEYKILEKQKTDIFEKWNKTNQSNFEKKQKYNLAIGQLYCLDITEESRKKLKEEIDNLFSPNTSLSDFDKHNKFQEKINNIREKQSNLGSFCPIATDSFSEKSANVYFQLQIIVDWKTLIEITDCFIKELTSNQ